MTDSIDMVKVAIADLIDVETKSIGTDTDAKEAAAWVQIEAKTEHEVDDLLDPSIKEAFTAHRKLTGQKKTILEKLVAAKNRVRSNLANWIAADRAVDGYYVKKSWRVAVTDMDALPSEYTKTVADEEALQKFVSMTEGAVAIPGCTIEQVNVLYAKADRP